QRRPAEAPAHGFLSEGAKRGADVVSQVSKSRIRKQVERRKRRRGRVASDDQGPKEREGATYSSGKPIDQAADETSIAVHVALQNDKAHDRTRASSVFCASLQLKQCDDLAEYCDGLVWFQGRRRSVQRSSMATDYERKAEVSLGREGQLVVVAVVVEER
ncbi:hypothetical protein BDP55DRAFT_639567, partial [Colletotrichum godetiae]